jgi:formylglycine-generating enzyme required for sulfatase activity
MVVIPGGTFTMGSPKTDKDSQDNERPQRQVTVASFAAGRFEVTRHEFAAFIEANPQRDMGGCTTRENGRWQYRQERSWRDPGFASIQQKDDDHLPARLVSLLGNVSRFKQTDDDPVVCVSWNDARAYVAWLNKDIAGKPFRLLTEAEWEWASRAQPDHLKMPTLFSFGNDPLEICYFGNLADSTAADANIPSAVPDCDDNFLYTAPVGSFARNAFDLFDMHGNVWEWVEDPYRPYPEYSTDSSALPPTESFHRVLRGGGWGSNPRVARSASRGQNSPDTRASDVGFRLARNPF